VYRCGFSTWMNAAALTINAFDPVDEA